MDSGATWASALVVDLLPKVGPLEALSQPHCKIIRNLSFHDFIFDYCF